MKFCCDKWHWENSKRWAWEREGLAKIRPKSQFWLPIGCNDLSCSQSNKDSTPKFLVSSRNHLNPVIRRSSKIKNNKIIYVSVFSYLLVHLEQSFYWNISETFRAKLLFHMQRRIQNTVKHLPFLTENLWTLENGLK